MCGIIGITCLPTTCPAPAALIVYKGLKRLEYRGYDSVGVACIRDNLLYVKKAKGKVDELEKKEKISRLPGYVVIGHTRWATHGKPSDINAHPQIDCQEKIAVVHNGIIENFREIKKLLTEKGHVFRSDTDTEVIPHLVEDYYESLGNIFDAFKKTIGMIKGSYAILMITVHEPEKIFFAKKDSPLIIGVGKGYNLVASDIPAVLEYTNKIIPLHEGWIGYITPSSIYIEDSHGNPVPWEHYIGFINWSVEDASKSGYPHYMLKEIHEQPRALKETYYGLLKEPKFEDAVKLLINAEKIYVAAAGTSFYASYYYALLTSILAGKLVYSFIASEYETISPTVSERDVLIVVSQSGETMDSLKALRAFKEKGAKIIAVSNVIDSAIPRESHIQLYTCAGPEIGVAATKTFTTQTLLLSWLAVTHAETIGKITRSEAESLREKLGMAGQIAKETIEKTESTVKKLAEWLSRKQNVYYLSRGMGVPIALEGALKLKEIAYIHAEAYPAGESKHGPIALIEPSFPVFFIIPRQTHLEKLLLGNIQEMKARGATIIGVAGEKTELADQLSYWIKVPETHWILTPITHTIPLQLLAYYTSVKKGYDPDKPRNLAKTVTVE